MAEADEPSTSQTGTADQEEGSLFSENGDPENGSSTAEPSSAEGAAPPVTGVTAEEAAGAVGPGIFHRALGWLGRWHPLLFLGIAFCLAAYAYRVYPESETGTILPAETLYADGLDRLYRVLNPDLPLLSSTPSDEALAARNALLNLFVFYRPDLSKYPQFINPHLLLGEANRLLAEYNPAMARKYYVDSQIAYSDAVLWENREDDPVRLMTYVNANFLGNQPLPEPDGGTLEEAARIFFETYDEEIAASRARRLEYIRFRLAEADVYLGQADIARPILEEIQSMVDSRRREDLRKAVVDEPIGETPRRRAFELGPDEYRDVDFLLARAYDELGMQERAKSWYLRYLGAVSAGRRHAYVVERLAKINMDEGALYHRVDPAAAERAYLAAVEYYNDLAATPSATREQRDIAVLGLADAYSRLAGLVPESVRTGIDSVSMMGRMVRGWLEDFSGQALPRRTLALPRAIGNLFGKPELAVPVGSALGNVVGGTLLSMAGGGLVTPYEESRNYHSLALEYFDRVAELHPDSEQSDMAAVRAAWESWSLGLKEETEARFERMLDPLSRPDLVLAARLGLATVAMAEDDLDKAQLLVLGGYAHPLPLWFTPTDADWRRIAVRLGNPANRTEPNPLLRVWETLPGEGTEIAEYAASGRRLSDTYIARFLRSLNTMLRRADFYVPEYFPDGGRNRYLSYVLSIDPELLTPEQVLWRNRLLLEEAWPYDLSQQGVRGNIGFPPFPPGNELLPGGLVDESQVRDVLLRLGGAWNASAHDAPREERFRRLTASNAAYRAALDSYRGDPGEILYAMAGNYEALAEIREIQGNHLEALSLTAAAARSYLDVSLRARGSAREMEALLAAGDAFFRAGLLERTVESQQRFLERFGYSTDPGSEATMSVVRAENLLGRAYWFLGDVERAIASFGRNIPRRTPDRFKSVYYIGRVMMDEGIAADNAALLGDYADPLPQLDRNGDPVITSALQSLNWLRQSPGINPNARAWRWATFDLARLDYAFAERARREALAARRAAADAGAAEEPLQPGSVWLPEYDRARIRLTEALDRYPLRRNGGIGVSVRVEPEDYADVMAARFETEYMLANTLLVLAEGRGDESLAALARVHFENMSDRERYANALFDTTLDRFQMNAAVIREEVEGGNWDRDQPLPRTRLGDDEGPTRSPERLREMLRNGMQLLATEYFRAGDLAAREEDGALEAAGFYRRAYETYQALYDRFGFTYGSLAMLGMGDALAKMGRPEDAANHYRMARNIAEMISSETASGGGLGISPEFWGERAGDRLTDNEAGYGL